MTGRLAGFITARLDETAATAGKPRTWKVSHHDCGEPSWDPCTEQPCAQAAECAEGRCSHRVVRGSDGMIIYDEGGHDEGDAAHIAANDPAFTLAWVAAMRKILAGHRPYDPESEWLSGYCATCGELDHRPVTYPCPTALALASIWSDHPDYPEAGACTTTRA